MFGRFSSYGKLHGNSPACFGEPLHWTHVCRQLLLLPPSSRCVFAVRVGHEALAYVSCDAIHLAQEADHTRFTGDTIPAVAAAIAGLHGMDDVLGVPVGWRGKGGGHRLLLLVQKATADDVPTYRITVCSGGGPGVQYHPVRNATPKLQRKLAITITNVPASRWVGFESKVCTALRVHRCWWLTGVVGYCTDC